MSILDKIRSEINDVQAAKVVSNRLDWTTENGVEFSFCAVPLLSGGEAAEIYIFNKRLSPQSAGLQQLNVEEKNGKLMVVPSMVDFADFVKNAKGLPQETAWRL
ncbi:hypothetical protein [Aeromonas caviae]|uniref:hypothetical protein n=1 Tax=Aeromonas caviae TaxID=648 RepID=UPI0011182291|nr:hypothetical protein [Aeromonas caviae]HEH9419895.1 hypothetical protein [Aeromonas sobria]